MLGAGPRAAMNEAERYERTAWLYDLDDREVVKDDVPFYLDWAARTGGSVLELACGTGRVTIPLAEAGHEVWGIDLSAAMLTRLREKLARFPEGVRDRVQARLGDMSSFDLERVFPLIIIPFRSFQLLTRDEQLRGCLASVRRHLAPGGRFILDVFRPYGLLDSSWIHGAELQWEAVGQETGHKVRRTDIRPRLDLERQIIYPGLVYYVERADGGEDRIV